MIIPWLDCFYFFGQSCADRYHYITIKILSPHMPLHTLRKRHASFAQKDYNGILKTDSFAVYSISDSFSYTLSSVTFFQKANHTTDAVLLLNYILFTISVSGLFLKFRKFKPRYSYKIYAQKKERVYLRSAYFLSNIKPINLRNSGLRNCF